LSFPLPEKITVWNAVGNDGLGGMSWSAPVVYSARIAYVQKKFTDSNGDTIVSTAVCYAYAPELVAGSMVFFGETTSPTPVTDSNDVRALSFTPTGGGTLRKAWFA